MEFKLKEKRESKGWTIADLVERSGVSKPTIIAIEKGRKDAVSTKTLVKIADAFECPVEELFSY